MNLVQRTINDLQKRRDHILNGGINCIPSPFPTFREDFSGIEQGKYYVVTAGTKTGKTQFMSYTFLYNSLHYAYNHPDQLRLKIFYYALEESPEDITKRYMSHLLYIKNKQRISTRDLDSIFEDMPVSQETLDALQDSSIKELLDFYEKTVEFPTAKNPTGVYNDIRKFMEDNGTVHTKIKKFKDELGNIKENPTGFDYYEPNDPNLYVLVILDHLSLVSTEKFPGTNIMMTLKQAADKLSEYFVELRNKYKITPILVQQQNFELDSLESFKNNKLRPTAQNLADSKYSSRDCNCLLGIFNPMKHELSSYMGYDIKKLRDKCRILEVILNRGGMCGGLMGLFFDGATCTWKELPGPDDKQGLERVYKYIEQINSPKSIVTFAWGRKIKEFYNGITNRKKKTTSI